MSTILVTGANSYVAGPAIKLFLEAGYTVRGTVRTESSGKKLLATFPDAAAANKISFQIVPDITKADNYADSFGGVVAVVHTASPFTLSPKDNEKDLLIPARDGAIAILDAAEKYATSTLKTVVTISSFASVVDISQGYRAGYVYSEKDWNPATWEQAAVPTADPAFAYCASKVIAEKAMWKWMDEHSPKGFVLTSITPPWVFGPYVTDLKTLGIAKVGQLNESMKLLSRLYTGELSAVPATDFAGCVDVRDLAQAVFAVVEKAPTDPQVAGQRFLVGQKFSYQAAADAIRAGVPSLKSKVPEGSPGTQEDTYILDMSKAEKLLGIKLRPVAELVVDSAKQVESIL